MMRAVLDTSVLVPRHDREALQIVAQDGRYVALWSAWIIGELHRVLVWRWIERTGNDVSLANQRRCGQAAQAMMRILVPTFELVDVRPPDPVAWDDLTDQDDIPIWATAVAGHATHVVSNNRRHFPPSQPDGRHMHQGIEYISSHDFLALVYEEDFH